jgi:hypothetical protein
MHDCMHCSLVQEMLQSHNQRFKGWGTQYKAVVVDMDTSNATGM